jgi:hypothetical protein
MLECAALLWSSSGVSCKSVPLFEPFPGLKPKTEPGWASTCLGFRKFVCRGGSSWSRPSALRFWNQLKLGTIKK